MKIKYLLILISALLLIQPISAEIPPHIQQGDYVYVNDTIDISGAVPPYPELAYWNGYDMYDSNASYIYKIPDTKKAYYDFWLDPTIFTTRTGKWYKYDPEIGFESHGNNLAFIVYPHSYKNVSMTYQNGSIFNLTKYLSGNYTEIENQIAPPVPIKHVSDYVLARGDPFVLSTNQATRLWLFGRINSLLSYGTSDSTEVNVSATLLSGYEPGNYKLMTEVVGNESPNFTVIYDSDKNLIKWFDPVTFTVQSISTFGLSPQVLLDKMNSIIPSTHDKFKIYCLTYQEPSIQITSIDQIYSANNETINEAGNIEYNTNVTAIEVKGYTNVRIGSPLRFVLDESRQTARTIKSYTSSAVVSGTRDPGDMRWFDAVVPIDIYNLPTGQHTLTTYTNLSDSGCVITFNIYSAPAGAYIPNKTVRYISGEHGEQEFVPTPTPIVVTQTVTVPGPERTVIVTVTPETRVVKEQQQIILSEMASAWATRIIIVVAAIIIIWYIASLILRRRELH